MAKSITCLIETFSKVYFLINKINNAVMGLALMWRETFDPPQCYLENFDWRGLQQTNHNAPDETIAGHQLAGQDGNPITPTIPDLPPIKIHVFRATQLFKTKGAFKISRKAQFPSERVQSS